MRVEREGRHVARLSEVALTSACWSMVETGSE